MKVKIVRKCNNCEGKGTVYHKTEGGISYGLICPICSGKGYVVEEYDDVYKITVADTENIFDVIKKAIEEKEEND